MNGSLTAGDAHRLAEIALAAIDREYPFHVVHLMNGDEDAAPPRMLHPVFHSCFDWHSAVHMHWVLLRLVNGWPALAIRERVIRRLEISFDAAGLEREAAYLAAPDRRSFERPYGLAWLLRLEAELAVTSCAAAAQWRSALAPLVRVARDNLLAWLPRLQWPIRSGTHNQTAFACALLLDSAALTGDRELAAVVQDRALAWYAGDRDAPLHYEPSAEDFLSPCLMEADLLGRILDGAAYRQWLAAFLPAIPHAAEEHWLTPVRVSDETDGRLVHLHGLNLSRAWNLGGIAARLPHDDVRRAALHSARQQHLTRGLAAALAAAHYAGSHWLPSFAVLAVTGTDG